MNQVVISPLNGIRFVPAGVSPNARYNRQQFDNEWYYDLIYNFQTKVFYAQPVQNKDYLSLQVMVNDGASVSIKLLNCNGITQKTATFTKVPYPSGISVNDITSSYYQFQDFQFWNSIASGIYYLSIEITFPDNSTKVFLSEPLSVEDKHENTVLFEYQNTYNKDNVLFEQTYQKFCLRVNGMMKLTPVATRTVFQDQGYSSVLLSGTAYRKWDFVFGGGGRLLPEYMIDMLNHIFAVDKIKIDGKQFTVLDDSSLEVEDADLYPLDAVKISLGEADNMNGFIHNSGAVIVGQIPSVPFVLWSIKMGRNGFVDYFIENPYYAPNLSGVDSVIFILNNDLQNKGYAGTFSVYTDPITSVHYLVYNLGSDEDFTEASWITLTSRFQTTMSTTQSFYAAKPKYDIQGNGNHIALIDTSQNVNYGFGILRGLTTVECKGFLLQNETRTMDIFYDEPSPITYLRIYDEASVKIPFVNITLPNLQEVIINNAQQLSSFNIYPTLASSKDTLFRVQINNTSLSTHPMVTPDPAQVPPTPIWKNLKEFYLMGSAMSDAEADQFAINVALYASAYYGGSAPPENGRIQIYSNPTPGYTATSLTARNFLQSLGWTIH